MKLLIRNVYNASVVLDTEMCEKLYVVRHMYYKEADVKLPSDTETGYFDEKQLAFAYVRIGKNPYYKHLSEIEALQEVFRAQQDSDPMAEVAYVIKVERAEQIAEMFAGTPRRWSKPEGK